MDLWIEVGAVDVFAGRGLAVARRDVVDAWLDATTSPSPREVRLLGCWRALNPAAQRLVEFVIGELLRDQNTDDGVPE